MKIGVIGASGKAGRCLAAEALRQGHEVTAIVRDPKKVDKPDVAVLARDIFSLTPEDLAGFEVVIDAFKAPEGKEQQHRTSMDHLIGIFAELQNVRLMVVGGAGSLYTDESRTERLMESKNFPPAFLPTASNMGAAFEKLAASATLWTYCSPAAMFDPGGKRTGTYTLGNDVLILNRAGESYVSYADYALAMIDEVMRGKFRSKRFTVVSERE